MKNSRQGARIAILWCMMIASMGLSRATARAADWPTHQGNAHRIAVTKERLALPLSPVWVHQPRHSPQPAWPPPTNSDFWHGESNLAPRVDLDRAYHVAAVGDSLLYGSSAEHAVHCLDAGTGEVRWSFYAILRIASEGPIGDLPIGRPDADVNAGETRWPRTERSRPLLARSFTSWCGRRRCGVWRRSSGYRVDEALAMG